VLRPDPAGGWACTQVDGAGFLAAAAAAGIEFGARRVQVLGAGGAGRAVAMAIAERRPSALLIHDPDPARQQTLVSDLRAAFPGAAATQGLERCEVLVNCSPIGMADDRLPLPLELIPIGGACYDVVNRPDTALLRAAAQRGCLRDHGRSMMLAEIPLIIEYLFGWRSAP
jgi:shikimate dehydrogenase